MEREHLKLISSEEKEKYLKVVEDYCKDIEKVKKRLIIKRIICNQIFSGTKIETIAETTAPKTNHIETS